MNGVASGTQSSQCHWSEAADHGAAVLGSVEPARQIAVISPEPHAVPRHGARRRATLAEVLEAGVALALSRPRNSTHSVVLVRNGKVWLLLAAETYYRAGLEAKKCGRKYLAVYDTRTPGKRLDRFNWALHHTLTDAYEFDISTESPESAQASSPAQLLVPPLCPPESTGDEAGEAFADWANQFIEWVGLAAVSPQLLGGGEPAVDQAICDNYTPEDAELKRVSVSLTTGAFTSSQVQAAWADLQAQPWAVMSVQGFAHMPITRSEKPRECGDVGYTLIKNGEKTTAFRYVH